MLHFFLAKLCRPPAHEHTKLESCHRRVRVPDHRHMACAHGRRTTRPNDRSPPWPCTECTCTGAMGHAAPRSFATINIAGWAGRHHAPASTAPSMQVVAERTFTLCLATSDAIITWWNKEKPLAQVTSGAGHLGGQHPAAECLPRITCLRAD